MARSDQLGRQWKLIQSLIASSSGIRAADLAEELGCHRRTIYRDLEALQASGFPIYNRHQTGREHIWSLVEGAKPQVPVPFDLAELMALYFSRDMLKVLKDTVFYDALASFFQKIKAMLPPAYRDYLHRVERGFRVGLTPYKSYSQSRAIIEVARRGILEQRLLEMVYFAMSRQAETRRTVAPYQLWYFDGTLYLIGFCRLRGEVRLFAVERIRDLRLSGETFEAPEDFEADRFMRPSFGAFRGDPVKVRIRFDAACAGYIRERIWHATQQITSQADGSILFDAEVAGAEEVKSWVLKWGARAEILAPVSLRAAVRAEIEAMRERYRHPARTASAAPSPPAHGTESA
jgi:predicted DNA-binding transcriptional regulator YafY